MVLANGHGRSYSTIRCTVQAAQICRSRLGSVRTILRARSFSTSPRQYLDTTPGVLHAPGQLGRYEPKATPNPRAQEIAVIGAGITGLSAAFHLSRDLPHANITIYEESSRVGGWIGSEQVEVNDGTVLFEWGPRTLRPDRAGNGIATLQLIHLLGPLAAIQMRTIARDHPAAVNRYVYYPDHLVKMPGPDPTTSLYSKLWNLLSIFREPLFDGVLSNVIREPTKPIRSSNVRDESIGDFVSRRFGKPAADNLASAMFHGIYAGDIYKLSARTLLSSAWHLETRDPADGHGILPELADIFFKGHSIAPLEKLGFLHRVLGDMEHDPRFLIGIMKLVKDVNVYSFTKGLGQLSDLILENLEKNPNVKLVLKSKVSNLKYNSDSDKINFEIGTEETTKSYDYVVSSASQKALAKMLSAPQPTSNKSRLQSRLESSALTAPNVMVVNLYYAEETLPIPRGFGYLIPRTIPAEQNPERALGVIFASETAGPRGKDAFVQAFTMHPKGGRKIVIEEETRDIKTNEEFEKWKKDNMDFEETPIQWGQDTATGTKLAVMLGGHWWEGWQESDLPSEEQGVAMAKQAIARHLGIDFEPLVAKARMQRNCIPQYHVGFADEMAAIDQDLQSEFKGRLKVGGVWWQGGVGVNDCVRSGRETSRSIREAWDHKTGLEKYTGPAQFVLTDKRSGMQTMDPLSGR